MPHLKKISKYKLKFKTKPWITATLQKSISIKNALFKRYIELKALSRRMKYTNNRSTTEIFFQR